MHEVKPEPGVEHYDIWAPSSFDERELARVNLFKGADLVALLALLRECRVRLLGPGEALVRAGESCPALYLVLGGRLRAQDPSSTVPDSLIRAGDSLGELFLLQDAVVPWTISAVDGAKVLAIDAKTAWALVAASHAFAQNLLALMAERARVGGNVAAGRELRASYQRHATLDETTGLHNRTWLESILPRQMTRSAMNNEPLGLLLIEIDELADYRTRFGAEAADHARYAVAQTLINNVRPTDLVACYGPAQFAVVLPEAGLDGALHVGERLRGAVSEAVILMSDNSILPSITVSVGAAQLEPSTDAPAFLALAHASLQSAKRTGGNRVRG